MIAVRFAILASAVALLCACQSDAVALRRSSLVPPTAPTATASVAPSATPLASASPTPSPSATPAPSPTPTPAATPSPTPTPKATANAGTLKVIEFPIPAPPAGSTPNLGGITNGPDGALWFTDLANAYVGRLTTAGAFTRYPLPTGITGPAYAIHTESDGKLWLTLAKNAGTNSDAFATISTTGTLALVSSFTNVGGGYVDFAQGSDGALWYPFQTNGQQVGRLTLAGAATSFAYNPNTSTLLRAVVAALDGNLWFTDSFANALVRVTPGGSITTVPLTGLSSSASPQGLTVGGDSALWFGAQGGGIGRYTTAGALSQYAVPANANGQPNPNGVCTGADGAVYFTSGNGSIIGRISNAGVVDEYSLGSPQSSSNTCTLGPDGAIWFTESNGTIGRLG